MTSATAVSAGFIFVLDTPFVVLAVSTWLSAIFKFHLKFINMAAVAEDNQQEKLVPDDIELNSVIVGIALHPTKEVLATGTINGRLKLFSYTHEQQRSNHKLMSFNHHKDSCRTVTFDRSGTYCYTGSADKSVCTIDLNDGAVTRRLTIKEGVEIYSILSINEHMIASGDDDGRVILWDLRAEVPAMCQKPCKEFISSLACSSDERTLLATCGEGTLSAFNLRSRKLDSQSENFMDEFLSVAFVKDDTKAVVGTSDGSLNTFNFGDWGNISDQYPLITGTSVDVILPVRDDVLVCGCSDGKIRAVQVFPNRCLGIVGTHEDLPVEDITISYDGKFVASASHDEKVKFHNLSSIKEIEKELEVPPTKKKKKVLLKTKENTFFKGL